MPDKSGDLNYDSIHLAGSGAQPFELMNDFGQFQALRFSGLPGKELAVEFLEFAVQFIHEEQAFGVKGNIGRIFYGTGGNFYGLGEIIEVSKRGSVGSANNGA